MDAVNPGHLPLSELFDFDQIDRKSPGFLGPNLKRRKETQKSLGSIRLAKISALFRSSLLASRPKNSKPLARAQKNCPPHKSATGTNSEFSQSAKSAKSCSRSQSGIKMKFPGPTASTSETKPIL